MRVRVDGPPPPRLRRRGVIHGMLILGLGFGLTGPRGHVSIRIRIPGRRLSHRLTEAALAGLSHGLAKPAAAALGPPLLLRPGRNKKRKNPQHSIGFFGARRVSVALSLQLEVWWWGNRGPIVDMLPPARTGICEGHCTPAPGEG